MSDENIIVSLAREPANQSLWMALYGKLRPPVYYVVYRLCRGQKELASDMTQEAFERFFKYADLKQFRNDAHALAYLREIARRRLSSEMAKLEPERWQSRRPIEEAPELFAPDGAEDTEVFHDLMLVAKQLKADERALLERMIAGDSIEQVAAKLNISYTASATRMHRLANKIRREFNEI